MAAGYHSNNLRLLLRHLLIPSTRLHLSVTRAGSQRVPTVTLLQRQTINAQLQQMAPHNRRKRRRNLQLLSRRRNFRANTTNRPRQKRRNYQKKSRNWSFRLIPPPLLQWRNQQFTNPTKSIERKLLTSSRHLTQHRLLHPPLILRPLFHPPP